MNLSALMGATPAIDSSPKVSAQKKDDSKPSGFDNLLRNEQQSAQSKESAAKTNAPKPTDAEAVTAESTEAPRDTAQANSDSDKPTEQDVWPPFGLTAMLLPTPEVAPPTLPAQTPGAAPADDALLAGLKQALPAPATPGITVNSLAAQAAKPQPEAATLELAPVLQQVVMATDQDAAPDAIEPSPSGVTLQGMSAPLDLRNLSSVQALSVDPTPTPDLNSEGFDDAIGARISWLADQKIGHAQIRITPHDLGQIDVKLQLDGDRVHATFTSAHADVRHALESSLPRLREMLGEQGMQLAHADVGQQSSPQDQKGERTAGSGDARADSAGPLAGADGEINTVTLRQRGLLDAYA